jgi:hypothetical protein
MWAGYLALANQQAASNGTPAPGLIDPTIYPLALGSGYSTDFHDITSGSNGFPTEVGYDLATGWGSPNGSGLINSLTGGGPPAGFTISASPTSITVAPGSSGSYKITTTISGNFDAAITLTAAGEGASESATFSPNPIAAPGAGTSTLTVKVGKNAAVGTHTITITATGGGVTETTKVTLIVAK